MAVNIDSVYQKVLATANKEQRGYITPQEFNLFADQAQKKIFEQYFYDINQFDRAHGNSTEFSDMLHVLEEKISPFRINNTSLTSSTPSFSDDFQVNTLSNWTVVSGTASYISPSSSNSYDGGIKVITSDSSAATAKASDSTSALTAGSTYNVNFSVQAVNATLDSYRIVILDNSSAEIAAYEDITPATGDFSFSFKAATGVVHDIVIEAIDSDATASTDITISNINVQQVSINNLPSNMYRLGEVYFTASGSSFPNYAAEVNANELTKYNLSPLTRPTRSNPVYVRSGVSSVNVYPQPIATDVISCNYISKPTKPKWGYVVVQGKALYNTNTSVDFQLHESEEVSLVNEILARAGVSIKQPDITAAAEKEEIKKVQQEKS